LTLFSFVRDSYIRSGDGFLCLYSITSEDTFNQIEGIHESIFRVKEGDNVPFILVGNKIDLENDREVATEKGRQLASKLSCQFFECTAKNNESVMEVFYELVRGMRRTIKREKIDSLTDKKKKRPCSIL
jgi:GTPase KRas protein